jgi:2-dehydro-3-deoxyphosphogluconate aldolase/(4S)-4-hydroxy-2-oxoglutarate aldolase
MLATEYFDNHLGFNPIMAIFRGKSVERTIQLCEAAWLSGVALVEVPVQNPESLQSFIEAVRLGRASGKEVGAGTIVSIEQLETVAEIGAQFIVSPGLDLEIVERARELGIPHLPGVASATEIGLALRSGCTWVKAFPASVLGESWVKAQKGPFPQVSFVATGGMSESNANSFLLAGYSAVAVGTAFETSEGIEELMASLNRKRNT